jgi:F0F1-type ATP synthase assembly protein I
MFSKEARVTESALKKNSEDKESADFIRKRLEEMNDEESKKARKAARSGKAVRVDKRKISGSSYSGITKRRKTEIRKTTKTKKTSRKSGETRELTAQNDENIKQSAETTLTNTLESKTPETKFQSETKKVQDEKAETVQDEREGLPSFLVEKTESRERKLRIPFLLKKLGERETLQLQETEEKTSQEEFEEISSVNSIRNASLAWSAAIGLFGSVVFMMAIGWLMDTLLGSEPAGIVIGIILGAVIGFYQFFRVMSKISD